MLIPFEEIVRRYRIQPKGVLHLGAHLGEEAKDYANQGVSDVLWVEANPSLIDPLTQAVQPYGHRVAQGVLSEAAGKKVEFKITNNGQSSSYLALGTHAEHYPKIQVVETLELETTTVQDLYREHAIAVDAYDFVNLDLQGCELDALRGMGPLLDHFSAVYCEVNQGSALRGLSPAPRHRSLPRRARLHATRTTHEQVPMGRRAVRAWRGVAARAHRGEVPLAMAKPNTWLLEHARDVNSQNGEDGILEKILLEVLPETNRWAVEFGAWDGRHLSNTCHLIERHGYSAVLIEGDEERANELIAHHASDDHIHAIHRFVGFTASDGLDAILDGTPCPKDFDLLSVDIDGNDYHVWSAVTNYRPKVVCIEFNPTIPTHADFVQPADMNVSQGTGIGPMVELARRKGYELVAATLCNCIFVRAEDFHHFEIEDNRPEVLRQDLHALTYLYVGFDGEVFLEGHDKLSWHNLKIRPKSLQQLPRWLRGHRHAYGPLRRLAFRLYRALWHLRG